MLMIIPIFFCEDFMRFLMQNTLHRTKQITLILNRNAFWHLGKARMWKFKKILAYIIMFLFCGYSLHYLARQHNLFNVTKLSGKESKGKSYRLDKNYYIQYEQHVYQNCRVNWQPISSYLCNLYWIKFIGVTYKVKQIN